MINLFNYLLISNIFTSALFISTVAFQFYLSYVFMVLFLVFYLFYFNKLYIHWPFVLVLIIISILSIFNVFVGVNSLSAFLKQLIGFLLNGVVYYLLIRLNNNRVDRLLRIYLKIAVVIAAIGVFQEISYLIGFRPGYDYTYLSQHIRPGGKILGMLRITSILQEPAHFGAAMMPAIFIAILSIWGKGSGFLGRKASLLIILSALLTFSLVVYSGIIVAVILIMINYRKLRLITAVLVILAVFSFVSYRYLPSIKLRIDDTVAVISGQKTLSRANLSTYTFCGNAFIAYKSFKNNPLLGSGIGSHPVTFDRYIGEIVDPDIIVPIYCKEDAGSLFFRLISETGLLGTMAFLYFIIRFYISKKNDGYYWAISNAIVCLFILNLIRNGNYFYGGFVLFVLLYYFTYKNVRVQAAIN